VIYYFSATGNTRWAAKKLSEATGEELIFISDQLNTPCRYQLKPDERIGFCFPVHGWRPPFVVRDFIARMQFDSSVKDHFTYAVITAGDTTGETFRIFENDLKVKGMSLHARCALLMPESYVGLPFMDVDKKEREKQKKLKAEEDLNAFLPNVIHRLKKDGPLYIGRWPRINSRLLGAGFLKLVDDSKFHVNSQRCVKCGICADVCPQHDIEGGLGYEPHWKHDGSCLTCFACYHHCPHHAIEFGKQTQHKGQYFYEKRN
jgi:NAD-dependent dihydropyrimidine dehydrogenase PreA subunit/flavodoxin